MTEIRILLADDHNILRQGIAQVLESQPDMLVVAQARNGEEAVRLAAETQPDIALLDVNMPEKDGIAATREISAASPDVNIIILTMYKSDELVFDAIKAGANGYLLKEVEMEDLLASVRAVAAGEAILDPAIAARVLDEFRASPTEKSRSKTPQLAQRDIQILTLLGQGMSNADIGEQLFISEKTVRNRLSLVFKQLHLRNRTEAALYALRKGLAEEDDTDSEPATPDSN
jgi:DNA-binding NarL/FixJ family response regulator